VFLADDLETHGRLALLGEELGSRELLDFQPFGLGALYFPDKQGEGVKMMPTTRARRQFSHLARPLTHSAQG